MTKTKPEPSSKMTYESSTRLVLSGEGRQMRLHMRSKDMREMVHLSLVIAMVAAVQFSEKVDSCSFVNDKFNYCVYRTCRTQCPVRLASERSDISRARH
jgi:hypothetical protein